MKQELFPHLLPALLPSSDPKFGLQKISSDYVKMHYFPPLVDPCYRRLSNFSNALLWFLRSILNCNESGAQSGVNLVTRVRARAQEREL